MVAGIALGTISGDRAVVEVPSAKAVCLVLRGVYFLVRLVEVGPVSIWYEGVGHAALGKVMQACRKRWYAEVFREEAGITGVRPREFEVVALNGCKQGVYLVGVRQARKSVEECDTFIIVAEDGVMELLEAEVDGGQLCEVEDVRVLCPEWDDDGFGFVETRDKESEDTPE